MLRVPTYGKQNRTVDYRYEIRNAILHKKTEELAKFSVSHPDILMGIIYSDSIIDPSYVASVCPDLIPKIEDHIVSLSEDESNRVSQQVPEVILRIAKMDGANPQKLWDPFVLSCIQFSEQYILEGLDVYDHRDIEQFIITFSLSENNCKALLDFTLYHTNIDQELYSNLFIKYDDIYGACDLINRGTLDPCRFDDTLYKDFQSHQSLTSIEDFERSFQRVMVFAKAVQGKANLDRIEMDLINMDHDGFMNVFVENFPDRETIPNYLTVKKIMKS